MRTMSCRASASRTGKGALGVATMWYRPSASLPAAINWRRVEDMEVQTAVSRQTLEGRTAALAMRTRAVSNFRSRHGSVVRAASAVNSSAALLRDSGPGPPRCLKGSAHPLRKVTSPKQLTAESRWERTVKTPDLCGGVSRVMNRTKHPSSAAGKGCWRCAVRLTWAVPGVIQLPGAIAVVPVPLGVTGNTSDSGSEESWFEPRRGNSRRRSASPLPYPVVRVLASGLH